MVLSVLSVSGLVRGWGQGFPLPAKLPLPGSTSGLCSLKRREWPMRNPASGCVEWPLIPGARHPTPFRGIEAPTGMVTPKPGTQGERQLLCDD